MLNTFTVVHITVLINNIPYSYQENKLTRNFYINHCIISCAHLQTVLNNTLEKFYLDIVKKFVIPNQ